MVMERPPCPNCNSTAHVQRAGFNRGGSQRMRCAQCRRYFTPIRSPQGCDPALKEQALRLCLEGMSFRAIGRQLGVHHQSVANWLNAHHDAHLPAHVEDASPTDTIEVDELYTYVGKKSTRRS